MSLSSSASPPKAEPVSHEAVLQWLDELRAVMRSTECGKLFDFEGVDALDVMLSPLYLATLKALRGTVGDASPSVVRLKQRARHWAFDRKVAMQRAIAAWRSPPAESAQIVLWTRDFTHTINMQPVAVELRRRGVACTMLACQAKVFNELRAQSIEAIFAPGAWPKRHRAARSEAIQRAAKLAAFGRWPVPKFNHPLAECLEATVRATASAHLAQAAETIANARAALDIFGCRVLVVGNDVTMEGRAGCRVAATRGIPSAVFMHGNVTAAPVHAMHCADWLLVFGEGQRRDLERLGVAAGRIIVCGAPSLDSRPRQTGQTHPLLMAHLGLRPREPWILVATSGPGHSISHAHHEKVVANLARLKAAFPDVPLVVKLHRKDHLETYAPALKSGGSRRFLVVPHGARGFPSSIFDWMQGCSVLLTGSSYVAVEAMLMDVPVITMDYHDEIHGADFIDFGATVHVRSGGELATAVGEILAHGAPEATRKRAHDFLRHAFYALDGRSAERGADALCRLAADLVSR